MATDTVTDTQGWIMRFKAVPGSRFTDADAEIVVPYLQELAQRIGYDFDGIPAEVILEDAERPESPLHRYFEWSDSIAARLYRLEQARKLGRSFRITYTIRTRDEETIFEMPAFVNLRLQGGGNGEADSGRLYIPVQKVLQSRTLTEQMISEAERDLRSLKLRLNVLRAIPRVAGLLEAVDLFLESGEEIPSLGFTSHWYDNET